MSRRKPLEFPDLLVKASNNSLGLRLSLPQGTKLPHFALVLPGRPCRGPWIGNPLPPATHHRGPTNSFRDVGLVQEFS